MERFKEKETAKIALFILGMVIAMGIHTATLHHIYSMAFSLQGVNENMFVFILPELLMIIGFIVMRNYNYEFVMGIFSSIIMCICKASFLFLEQPVEIQRMYIGFLCTSILTVYFMFAGIENYFMDLGRSDVCIGCSFASAVYAIFTISEVFIDGIIVMFLRMFSLHFAQQSLIWIGIIIKGTVCVIVLITALLRVSCQKKEITIKSESIDYIKTEKLAFLFAILEAVLVGSVLAVNVIFVNEKGNFLYNVISLIVLIIQLIALIEMRTEGIDFVLMAICKGISLFNLVMLYFLKTNIMIIIGVSVVNTITEGIVMLLLSLYFARIIKMRGIGGMQVFAVINIIVYAVCQMVIIAFVIMYYGRLTSIAIHAADLMIGISFTNILWNCVCMVSFAAYMSKSYRHIKYI